MQCSSSSGTNVHSLLLTLCLARLSQWMLVAHLMASCQPPSDRSVLGPWGHPIAAQQAFPAPVCGSRAFTSKLGYSPSQDPPPPYITPNSGPQFHPATRSNSNHRPHSVTTASLQKPLAYPRAGGNLFFHPFPSSPKWLFLAKCLT